MLIDLHVLNRISEERNFMNLMRDSSLYRAAEFVVLFMILSSTLYAQDGY